MTNIYHVTKNNYYKKMVINSYLDGLDITPKNNLNYDGIMVNKLVLVNSEFIKVILKKKMKRKLETYLSFVVQYMSDDEDDGSSINQILNDIKRYKQILNYKYRKYLEDKYTDSLLKKLSLLEKEFNMKLFMIEEKQNEYIDENINNRRR